MTFVTLSDGTRVRYEVAGPVDGNPVLFLCGITVPLETFDRNFGYLVDEGLRVYRFDYPGRGHSDRPRAPYDLDFFARAAVSFLDAVGERRPVSLVGLSMGGAVAGRLAAGWPTRVDRVALVDPLFFTIRRLWHQKLLWLPLVGELAFGLAGKSILTAGQGSDFEDKTAHLDFMPHYCRSFDRPGFPQAVLVTLRSAGRWTVTPHFVGLGERHRVLVIWGTKDRTIPYVLGQELKALVGRCTFVTIEGAGHVPQWERPDEVNPALGRFLG